MQATRSYGELPTYPEIKELFKKHVDGPYYKIENDRQYDGSYNDFALFCLLVKLNVQQENGNEAAGEMASSILQTLGVEWA